MKAGKFLLEAKFGLNKSQTYVYIYRVGREDDEEEEEKRQSFYIRLKEKPLAKNDSPQ